MVRLGSNSASLAAQRRLGEQTANVGRVSERLSSGMRITRASDDAAGLSVASSLNFGAHVAAVGVRNINDGVSALSIAEGGLGTLTSITIRIQELAEQASNGTFSTTQRTSLDREANALVNEYNRILDVTQFNGVKLLNGTFTNVGISTGSLEGSSTLSISVGALLGTAKANGVFTAAPGTPAGADDSFTTGDFNGDGKIDIFNVGFNNDAQLFLGVGDGSFTASTSFRISTMRRV